MSIQSILAESMRVVSMESEGDGVSEEPAIVAAPDLDVANAEIDAIEENTVAETELSDTENSVEIIEEGIVALESLEEVVRGYQANGGMDKQAAALLAVSLQSIMGKFGVDVVKTLPAMESFEESGGRIGATAVAMEGIGDSIKGMWNALSETISKAGNAVLRWLGSSSAVFTRLSKAASALAAKAEDSSGTPKKKSLTVANAHHLISKGKLVGLTPAGIGAISAGMISSINAPLVDASMELANIISSANLAENADDVGKKLSEAVEKINKSVTRGVTPVKLTRGERFSPWWNFLMVSVNDFRESWSDEVGFVEFPGIPGEYAAFFKISKKEGVMVKQIYTGGRAPLAKPMDADALEPKELAKLCEAIASSASKLLSEKKSEADIKKLFSDAKKAGGKLEKAAGKSDSVNAVTKNAIRTAMSNMKTVENNARQSITSTRKHAINVLNAAYAFARASYSNLGSAAAEEKEADKPADKAEEADKK